MPRYLLALVCAIVVVLSVFFAADCGETAPMGGSGDAGGDLVRFTPSMSGPGEMKSAQRRVKELLREIERARPVQDMAT